MPPCLLPSGLSFGRCCCRFLPVLPLLLLLLLLLANKPRRLLIILPARPFPISVLTGTKHTTLSPVLATSKAFTCLFLHPTLQSPGALLLQGRQGLLEGLLLILRALLAFCFFLPGVVVRFIRSYGTGTEFLFSCRGGYEVLIRSCGTAEERFMPDSLSGFRVRGGIRLT